MDSIIALAPPFAATRLLLAARLASRQLCAPCAGRLTLQGTFYRKHAYQLIRISSGSRGDLVVTQGSRLTDLARRTFLLSASMSGVAMTIDTVLPPEASTAAALLSSIVPPPTTQTLPPKPEDTLKSYLGSLSPQGRLVVVGHRGSGKNKSKRLQWVGGLEPPPPIRENTLVSFVTAAQQGADFIEFDVQVTKDGVPIIFHDDHILTSDKMTRRVGELTLEEFKGVGPQKGGSWGGVAVSGPLPGKELLRQASDGIVEPWICSIEDSLCTLGEAFQEVPQQIGFNIEVKFLDTEGSLDEIRRVLDAVVGHVLQNAKGRRIVFSTFHPDAAILLRQMQSIFPVFFLTDGGGRLYTDARRNSVAEAVKLAVENKLQGIVSEATAVLKDPSNIAAVKQSNLQLLTYGEANNLPEAVYFQHQHGVDGVIVDHVRQIATVARLNVAVEDSQPTSYLSLLQGEALKSPIAIRAA